MGLTVEVVFAVFRPDVEDDPILGCPLHDAGCTGTYQEFQIVGFGEGKFGTSM